jgi:hypothetical protein
MSAGEAAANRVKREGAISFMKKPIDTNTLDKLFGEMTRQSGGCLSKYYWLKIIRRKAKP